MYCSFCGKEIPDGSTFCGYCGKKLVYRNDGEDDGSYVDGYEDDVYEGLEPVFVAPHWNTYRADEEWDEESSGGSGNAGGLDDAAVAAAAAGERAETGGSADAGEGEAPETGDAVESSDRAEDEADKVQGASDSKGVAEGAEAAAAAEADEPGQEPDSEGAAPQGETEHTVRPVSKPISDKTFLKDSSNGVHVPSQVVLGETAPRKRVVPIGLVVVIAAAALLAGGASAYSVAQYYFEQKDAATVDAAPAPADAPADASHEADGTSGSADAPADGDAPAPSGADSQAIAEETPSDADAQPVAEEPEVPTGFSSNKKLIAALQKPLDEALEDNFSDATMRLLVIDELDFMPPALATALVQEAGYASPYAYSRKMVDEQARQLSTYASTWSFKLARGKKCSARTIERIERQGQILGVDLPIEEAYKIEAVTGTYPSDYNAKNVDDEGLYHQVTSYTAIQSNGRWYLYTDALVAAGKAEE